jgi:Holliday junction resolvase RusA-like endonuclease
MYLSPEGRAWFEEAAWVWKAAKGRRKVITGKIEVCADLFYCRPLDLDNAAKCTLDSMTKSGVIADDNQVDSLVMHRYKVKTMKEERLEVEIFEL